MDHREQEHTCEMWAKLCNGWEKMWTARLQELQAERLAQDAMHTQQLRAQYAAKAAAKEAAVTVANKRQRQEQREQRQQLAAEAQHEANEEEANEEEKRTQRLLSQQRDLAMEARNIAFHERQKADREAAAARENADRVAKHHKLIQGMKRTIWNLEHPRLQQSSSSSSSAVAAVQQFEQPPEYNETEEAAIQSMVDKVLDHKS
jgi:hypothetical protein